MSNALCKTKADGMLGWAISVTYGPGFDYVGGTGWNSGKRKVEFDSKNGSVCRMPYVKQKRMVC
ncbi:hypothetical protein CP991_29720 [Escherichia coli]|nr:hypothetical protein CP991_29720 [Escherichia coli]